MELLEDEGTPSHKHLFTIISRAGKSFKDFSKVDCMAKIIVFHFTEKSGLPKLSEELKELKKKFLEMLKDHPDVTFHGTYVNERGIGICDWGDPKVVKEMVEKVLGSLSIDLVISVKKSC